MLASPVLKKPEVYESKTIRLTSPILHIGSAVSRLNPFEYVQTAKKVYLPNQEALAKAFKKQGGRFLDDYIQAINDREDISHLLKQAFGDQWWSATDTDGEPIFPNYAISQKLTDQRITDLRPMIRNGMGRLFIPGSSIKGAIRTAIVYHLLKHAERYQTPAPKRISEIEKKLRSRLGELSNKNTQKFVDDDLFMESLFSEFTLTYQDRTFPGRSQNTDFLRALKVSDCEALIEDKMTTKKGQQIPVNLPVAAEVIISSRFPDFLAKYKASIYVEMVRNVQTEFTLTLDTEMLAWFKHKQGMKIPFTNLNELLQICQGFSQDQWDYEHDYWQDIKNNPRASARNLDFNYIREFYSPEESPFSLRLGWGSGMTGTTIDLLFEDELRAEIRDICGISAPKFEAPKSRRTVVNPNGEIRFVPGWVKFKVL
ncbi:type III-A CRISPR-associated RAMP protein Csm5 [Aetokthonos hydrillicola Thurmond2011]|jgi:CRISPR-associated protein Csm5|uniref:CRISPR system Cms protein Csm5 n=1 Tax=Aetokthonos hydrillicola Thurmond2011 TaxID=2712845 RepID=A0AAP5I6F6_9CYAN|nr:type III-A CRISPR-associated RAMP protein Csm5 [Aetokthonos hydrillicola]MBO3464261.1 type III-A CRISPR-associated RAMP protein Csm5 [Aetokthonos hydrillicola CCALA 1050]MBW4590196.1 type III-A CRISPR-associated RAMP protein Csm5 [Aetokthonos hydrillicola CCALA 1050]MDR9893340.1 type III-A CRISPR-associated RAMP protein Csm5 [Aetokthonos hydrillicola Thurmond2011]